MRHRCRLLAAAALTCSLALDCAAEARAHFLFVKVGPMAEGGRSAEVYFSEKAEAGDPRFVDKVSGTALWLQTRPGTFERLRVTKGVDRLRAALPAGASLSVVGACEYGVVARPDQTPFLLRYYPKALSGRPEVLNGLSRATLPEVRLEIMTTVEPDHVKLVGLREGKLVPDAVFHTVDADLTESKVSAGPDGSATWTPPSPGRYSVYLKEVTRRAGEHQGRPYDEIREFATLAFDWPLDRHDADPEAVATFEKAVAARASWHGFRGFSADAAGSVDGRPYSGKVVVAADGSVKAEVDDPVARPWLEDQLRSIATHRLPEGDRPRPVLWFADSDEVTHSAVC